MSPALSIVAGTPAPPKAETVAQRVQRLQREARTLAHDHVNALTDAMADLAELAGEVAAGGEVYSAGAREAARSLAEDLAQRRLTLGVIVHRSAS